MSSLRGRVVLVTGAARGSGRCHCERLAEEGADVIAVDAPETAGDLEQTATAVVRRGVRAATGLADVGDFSAVTAAVDAAVAELGRIDVVVANAGIHPEGARTWEITPQAWQQVLDVNLNGVWHTVKAGVPHIGPQGGSIVIVSSTNGIRGTANTAHYTASKHAVVGLARTLANELGPRGIRVNTVHPGAVGTATVLNEATFRRLRPDLENPTGGRRRGAPSSSPAPGALGRPRRCKQRRRVPGLGRGALHHRHPDRGRRRSARESVGGVN